VPAGVAVVTTDSPPPPQSVITKTQVVPVQVDRGSSAAAFALAQMVQKYPETSGAAQIMQSLMDQWLNANPTATQGAAT
jgi:hypothetical protein